MATTPPEQPGTTTTTTTRGYGRNVPNMPMDVARLPIPGNAEFAVYALASLVLLLVVWIDGNMSVNDWIVPYTAITFAYLISRGIAKASRVLEQ
jgi:hypothetical protein